MRKLFPFLIFTLIFAYQEFFTSLANFEQTTGNKILPSYFSIFTFGNPLGIERKNVAFSYLSYLAGTHLGGFEFCENKNKTQYGIYLHYFNSGNIKKTDEYGEEYGEYLYSSISLVPLFAHKFGKAKIGLETRLLYSFCDTLYSLGIGGSVMGMAEVNIFRVGSGIKNLGFILKPFYQNHTLQKPEILAEFSADLTKPLKLSEPEGVSINWGISYSDFGISFHTGTEIKIKNLLIFRLGYNSFKEGFLTGFSFGLEIKKEPTIFSYGFLPYKELGNAHIFNLAFNI
uniref:Type IX secretion system membrane protein PorP/SprF n=1 Tax=candidate division WOR-3 bacterium TaxID=2052148 RepID=A0A7V3ZUA3_UNCW3